MKGKRLDDNEYPFKPGEYSKCRGVWFCNPPKEGIGMGSLEDHDIIEHEDETITVSPSILIEGEKKNGTVI